MNDLFQLFRLKVIVSKVCYMHLYIGFYVNIVHFSYIDVAYTYNLSISETEEGVAINLRLVWARW